MTDLYRLECVAWRYIAWRVLIEDMGQNGYTNADVARAMAVPLTTLREWCNGREPRYSSGEALLLRHSKIFGAENTKNRISEFRQAALMRSSNPSTGDRIHAKSRRESFHSG